MITLDGLKVTFYNSMKANSSLDEALDVVLVHAYKQGFIDASNGTANEDSIAYDIDIHASRHDFNEKLISKMSFDEAMLKACWVSYKQGMREYHIAHPAPQEMVLA